MIGDLGAQHQITMSPAARRGSVVRAEMTFSVDTGEKPVNETFEVGRVIRRRTGTTQRRTVEIANGRDVSSELSLDSNGFELADHGTRIKNFFDPDELAAVYYPEVETLVKRVSGAYRVHVFDHTLRSGNEAEQAQRKIREPVLWAHNDYTEWSGPQRLRELLPDESEGLLRQRFAIIQVWRAIDRPILANPLALVDASTVLAGDLIKAERRYPHRVGETYQLSYNAGQRWFFFPDMTRDEVLVFKVYDSAKDGRARFTPHCSFVDPDTPANAPPRQSIEVRTLAFF
ncbi:MAG: CmcJ/NvfI family oxidoreductase [Burkholderiales bacterium]